VNSGNNHCPELSRQFTAGGRRLNPLIRNYLLSHDLLGEKRGNFYPVNRTKYLALQPILLGFELT